MPNILERAHKYRGDYGEFSSGYRIVGDLIAEIERLRAILDSKLHQRRCWNCGYVDYHADRIVPYVLCGECGSQDTRPIREAAEAADNEPNETT